MITDLMIADFIADLYNQPSQFDRIINADKVCIGIKEFQDAIVIIGRGSYTLLDWIRDAMAIGVAEDPDIGTVPFGFNIGVSEAYAALEFPPNKDIYYGGHSLGADHACQLAGKTVARGGKVKKLVLAGCATPGSQKLKYLLSGTDIVSYKNLTDPVTTLPPAIIFQHVRNFTALSVTPNEGDALGIFAPHRFIYYHKGIQEYGKSAP